MVSSYVNIAAHHQHFPLFNYSFIVAVCTFPQPGRSQQDEVFRVGIFNNTHSVKLDRDMTIESQNTYQLHKLLEERDQL